MRKAGITEIESVLERIATEATRQIRRGVVPSRHIPAEVKRAVWWRDRAANARSCPTRDVVASSAASWSCTTSSPYAMEGPATVGNISLRCRRHNQYEAELVFGAKVAASRRTGERAT